MPSAKMEKTEGVSLDSGIVWTRTQNADANELHRAPGVLLRPSLEKRNGWCGLGQGIVSAEIKLEEREDLSDGETPGVWQGEQARLYATERVR